MDNNAVARINAAVDECLDLCMAGSTPPEHTLNAYCMRLQNDVEWMPPEIELVRSIVMRVILKPPRARDDSE